MKKILFICFFVSACGHSQIVLKDDSLDTIDPPPPQNNAVASSASPNENDPCQGFINSVVLFEPGAGAGFGQTSFPDIVFGPPRGNGRIQGSLDVLSLGDHGRIVVDLSPCIITDREGIDFIVFENPFLISGNLENPFAEIAIVSVSNDGETFTPFPCEVAGYPYTGCAGWRPVLSHPDNRLNPFDVREAGGDPFDLSEIGVDQARYVKIEDISAGGFPPSVGFDLDAVAVVHGVQQSETQ